MIVTFCGHKTIYGHEDLLRKQLYDVLNSSLKKNSEQETPLTLYCGGYGPRCDARPLGHASARGGREEISPRPAFSSPDVRIIPANHVSLACLIKQKTYRYEEIYMCARHRRPEAGAR